MGRIPPEEKRTKPIAYMETTKVTRVEVIDENGRSYVNWNEKNHVEISLQDDDRTLKVFITKKQSTEGK